MMIQTILRTIRLHFSDVIINLNNGLSNENVPPQNKAGNCKGGNQDRLNYY